MNKIIHYCWFGPKPLPKLAKKCIDSWKKIYPDYEIKLWNEENVDLNECEFIKEAYAQKKWAFVADYTRAKVLYEYGGIYMDTDMELTKSVDDLMTEDFVIGVEDSGCVAAGIIIVKNKHNKYVKKLLDTYRKMKFNENNDLFTISIPKILTNIFEKELDLSNPNIINKKDKELAIYPREYFYPLSYDRKNNIFTENTYGIHYYDASWISPTNKISLWLTRHELGFLSKYLYSIYNIFKKQKIDKRNLITFLIPFCLFMFLLLVFSPGIISYDSNNQWEQVVSGNINNAHPFFTTYFMLLLSKVWNSPTVVLVFQVFIFSYFWMNIARIIRDNNKKGFKKILIYTIVISFIPIISLYSITLWKDILYSYYLIFIIYYIYKGIKNNFDYSYLDTLNVGILVTLVFCYRHNGMIVAFLLLISFFIIFLKNKLNMKKIILTILVFLSLNGLISIPKNFYLEKVKKNEIHKESLSTIDSYMVWMYGAHLNDGNIGKEDLKKLDNVIPTEEWEKLYNPYLINSIGSYEKDAEYYNDNIKYFRKLFIETSLKHPLTIIEHYLKADSLLWSPIPLSGRYVYIFDYTEWWPDFEFNNGEIYGYEGSKIKFPFIKKIVEKLTAFTLRFPINVIYYPALALYVSMLLVYMLIKQNKNKKYWLLLTPCLFNTLSLLPINLAQDLRYVYINYLTLLVVGLIFIVEYDFNKFKILLNKIVKKTSS